MLTTNLAIVAPVTEADDRAAREAVWQQVTERIRPADGKALHAVRAVRRRMGTESVQSIQRHPRAETNRRCSCTSTHLRSISWMSAQRHIWTAFWSIWRSGNEQTVGDTKMCTAYLKGDTAEARSHMEWHIANMFGELMPDCGIYFLREGRSYLNEAEHKKILCNMKDYAICVVKLVWEKAG